MKRGNRAPSKFGLIVKALRKERGLSLQEAADRLGTMKGYICGWETGAVAPPSIKFLRRVVKLYGKVELGDLAELAYVEKAPPEIRDRLMLRIADNWLISSKVTA